MLPTTTELETWRCLFPVTKKWIFLDHAAVAAPPSMCAKMIQEWAADLAENGIASFLKWFERMKTVRALAGELLNAHPHDVCFVGSTTQGINIVADGFPWQPGDNIVTVADEYPSNQYPWMNQRRHGVEYRPIPSHAGRVRVADLQQACDAKTRVLTISSVEFSTGFRNDLLALGEWCRARGIFFMVDGIQSLGVIPMNVQDLPIDAIAADSHKWLLGPEGAGIFYLKREWIDRLNPVGVGSSSVIHAGEFSRIDWQPKPNAGRYEGGTLNVGGILGMGESIRFLLEVGIARIHEQVQHLTNHLIERLQTKGYHIFSSLQPHERSGIVAIDSPGHDPEVLKALAREAGFIINVRGGHLRVSPHVYNTLADIDQLVDHLPICTS